jgi:hypothetical protein
MPIVRYREDVLIPFFLLIGICMGATGCARHVEYAVENSGNQVLNGVVVAINSNNGFEHGILIPKSHASFSGSFPIRADNLFTLSWTDGNGSNYHAEIRVSSAELQDKKVRTFRITDAMIVEKSWLLEK